MKLCAETDSRHGVAQATRQGSMDSPDNVGHAAGSWWQAALHHPAIQAPLSCWMLVWERALCSCLPSPVCHSSQTAEHCPQQNQITPKFTLDHLLGSSLPLGSI